MNECKFGVIGQRGLNVWTVSGKGVDTASNLFDQAKIRPSRKRSEYLKALIEDDLQISLKFPS
jgi:hypothetical protein